jgi:hypothetical protein
VSLRFLARQLSNYTVGPEESSEDTCSGSFVTQGLLTRDAKGGSIRWAFAKGAVPKYNLGDRLRIELSSGNAVTVVSVWIRVDRCDNRREIVFGTIDVEPSQELGRSFRCGSKLAASYRQVREQRLPELSSTG